MFLYVLYIVTGICFLLMASGLLYPSFWVPIPKYTRSYVRTALFFFGVGLILTATYQAYVYYVIRPQL